MPEQEKPTFKSKLAAVREFFKFRKNKKKVLDEKALRSELIKFMHVAGYTDADIAADSEKFQDEYVQYLKDQGYDCTGLETDVVVSNSPKLLPKRITKLSEDYNDCLWDFPIYTDTTKMLPGFVCYVVVQVAPTDKKPYVTYKPSARVITQIHDTGVNQGTTFFTYDHQVTRAFINGKPTVIAEEEVIYSPLTKEHAEYVCKLLNAQSKNLYKKSVKANAKANVKKKT